MDICLLYFTDLMLSPDRLSAGVRDDSKAQEQLKDTAMKLQKHPDTKFSLN